MEEICELKKKTINLHERRVIISVIQNSKLFKRRTRKLIARRGVRVSIPVPTECSGGT